MAFQAAAATDKNEGAEGTTYTLQLRFDPEEAEALELVHTGTSISVTPAGDAADLSLALAAKGAGTVTVGGTAVVTGTATATPTNDAIVKANGSGKLAAGWVQEVLAISDLSDVTAKTGLGTEVVMSDSPSLATPTLTQPDIGDFTAAPHDHSNALNGALISSAGVSMTATDRLLGRSTIGAGASEEIACTAAGRALLDDASASDQRTTLGLGSLATQSGTFSGTSSGTNTGDQTITLTGDVTGSGTGSFAATIAAGAVTYAKMQDVSATDKVLGRVSSGAGDVEEIACTAAGRALLDDATAGDQRTTLGLGSAAVEAAATAAAASTIPKSSSLGQLAREWIRPFFFDRRILYVQHDVGATTVSRFGLAADPTASGTQSAADTVSGCYELCMTGTVSGNTAGRITAANVVFRDWSPRATWKVLTAASIANLRFWIGFTSADLSAVSGAPTTQHVAAFRYDTGVDGTAFWRCVTCDGASNVTTTTTTVAISGSTAYNLRIEFDEAGGSIKFYVDETLAATHTTNRPASATGLLAQWCVTTLTSAAKRLSWSWFGMECI